MIKLTVKNALILISILAFLTLPALVLAAGNPRLYLSTEKLELETGQEVAVSVFIENAPVIYGVEGHFTFDPTRLEVIDLAHGDFLSADPDNETFILQNQADNQTGRIDYALALLNPAPPVEGDGLLATIVFKAKTDGTAVIQVEEALFGTQTGEAIVPLVEHTQLTISPVTGQPIVERLKDIAPQPENNSIWLVVSLGVTVVLIGLVGGLVLLGGWFWLARTRKE